MLFRKMRFRWLRFHVEISKVTEPNFTKLVSPNAEEIAIEISKVTKPNFTGLVLLNAGEIAVDGMIIRF